MFNLAFFSESRRPVPGWLLVAAIAAAGILPILLALKAGETNALHLLVTILIGGVAFYGFAISPLASAEPKSVTGVRWVYVSMTSSAAGIVAISVMHEGAHFHALWPLCPLILMLAHKFVGRRRQLMRHLVVPLLFGSAIMFAGALVGHPEISAFPAAIATLFVSVLRFTLDIEEDVFRNHADHLALEVHHHYRARLAMAAVVFFLFGTVSLWPWLGTLYNQSYFWVLLIGVLLPLVFFWGRIRQPKMEGARTALIRFNRIAPVIGFLHIIAILIA